jgi:hypothetical protein
MALIKPEGLPCEEPLLIAGEAHSISLAQGRIHSPGPEDPFLEVLKGMTATKPGVQHPMGKHVKGGIAAPHRQVGSQKMQIPDAVHHHGIVVVVIVPNPAQKGKGKESIDPGATQGLHGHLGKCEVGRTGRVERSNLQGITEGMVGCSSLPDSLNRATTHWINGLNNVENPQRYELRFAESVKRRLGEVCIAG